MKCYAPVDDPKDVTTKEYVDTYGPIIHNSEVVNDLKKKGVEVINSIKLTCF